MTQFGNSNSSSDRGTNDGASFDWKASSSSSEASYSQAINFPSPKTILLHRYCFISGRNGSSLYVKLGASCKLFHFILLHLHKSININHIIKFSISIICSCIFTFLLNFHFIFSLFLFLLNKIFAFLHIGFAFGLLIYSALRISYDIFFISSFGTQLYECASFLTLSINILFPLYALLTLLFIMKYMNVVINVNSNLARIFLYHAIGTSLSLWVFTIIHETTDAIAEYDAVAPGNTLH